MGASDIWGQAEWNGTVQHGGAKAQRDLLHVYEHLIVIYAWEIIWKTEPDPSLSCIVLGQEEMWTNWGTRNSFLIQEQKLSKGGWRLLQVSLRGCGVSVHGDIQTTAVHVPEQSALADCTHKRCLDYMISRGPCQSHKFCGSVTYFLPLLQ